MKKIIKIISVVIVLAILAAVPVQAVEIEPMSSAYFLAYDSFLWKTSGTTFQIWFDVTARSTMNELGVSKIEVERSVDGVTWTTMRVYNPSTYPQMLCEDTGSHTGHVAYTGSVGYYYRARVTFYATNSTGSGYRIDYAETIKY